MLQPHLAMFSVIYQKFPMMYLLADFAAYIADQTTMSELCGCGVVRVVWVMGRLAKKEHRKHKKLNVFNLNIIL